jgi:hypothetical protein
MYCQQDFHARGVQQGIRLQHCPLRPGQWLPLWVSGSSDLQNRNACPRSPAAELQASSSHIQALTTHQLASVHQAPRAWGGWTAVIPAIFKAGSTGRQRDVKPTAGGFKAAAAGGLTAITACQNASPTDAFQLPQPLGGKLQETNADCATCARALRCAGDDGALATAGGLQAHCMWRQLALSPSAEPFELTLIGSVPSLEAAGILRSAEASRVPQQAFNSTHHHVSRITGTCDTCADPRIAWRTSSARP